MSDRLLKDLIVRMASDPGFAAQVTADPVTALAGFDLTADERASLASLGADVGGGASALDSRQSKSSILPATLFGGSHDASMHEITHAPIDHHTGIHHPIAHDPIHSDGTPAKGGDELTTDQASALQASQEHASKTAEILSNIMKKIDDTDQGIIQNLK